MIKISGILTSIVLRKPSTKRQKLSSSTVLITQLERSSLSGRWKELPKFLKNTLMLQSLKTMFMKGLLLTTCIRKNCQKLPSSKAWKIGPSVYIQLGRSLLQRECVVDGWLEPLLWSELPAQSINTTFSVSITLSKMQLPRALRKFPSQKIHICLNWPQNWPKEEICSYSSFWQQISTGHFGYQKVDILF